MKLSPMSITIVDSDRNKMDKITRRNCCLCIPELVGVFAILSMYFFLGIFTAAYSFAGLGYAGDATVKALLGISGCLNTFMAITSALGIGAIKKEKYVMMRRISIVFWIITILLLIFSTVLFILDIIYKPDSLQDCKNYVRDIYGDTQTVDADCSRAVDESLAGEAFIVFFTGTVSLYFAYVIFRFTKRMKKDVLPFIAPPIDGQRTPMNHVGSQPPTSINWVPPPTYEIKTNNISEDLNPNSGQNPN